MGDRSFDPPGRIDDLAAAGLHRRLSPADRVDTRAYFAPPSGAELPVLDAETRDVFASNNYLGLTSDERVQNAMRRAASTVGTGAGASRLVTGDTLVHRDLERQLAETKGTERALAFSSGYAANVGTISALEPDVIFSDERNHASIVDGCRLSDADVVVYDHCDIADLDRKLAARATAETVGQSWLVVTDSVFSMDGTVAPLAEIADVVESYGAWLLVDEAHATGLYANGGGVVQAAGIADRVHVQMGTLSKALASQGGYVAGSESLVELLVNRARSFVYSTGLAPGAAAAASEALHIARHGECRNQLWENVAQLRDGLTSMGYEVRGNSHVLPVIIGPRADAVDLADELAECGVVVPAIRPPTVPEGTSRLRVTPMATHDPEDIVACLEAFRDAGEAVGLL